MYYRILVNKNGAPFFRTSRLHNGADMVDALLVLEAGTGPDVDGIAYEVKVLEVNDDGDGHIMSEDEIKSVSSAISQQILDALPTGSAEIAAALNPTQADPQA